MELRGNAVSAMVVVSSACLKFCFLYMVLLCLTCPIQYSNCSCPKLTESLGLPIYILFNHRGHFSNTRSHASSPPAKNKQEIYCLQVTIPVFVSVCGLLCCLLCQNPALTVTFKCTSSFAIH